MCNARTMIFNTLNTIRSVFSWVYDVAITSHLRDFYLQGPVWYNMAAEDICASIMPGTRSKMWTDTPENLAECNMHIENRFQSWSRGITSGIYFAILIVIVFRCICGSCCGSKHDHCCGARDGGGRVVSVDELRRLLADARPN